MAEKFRQQGRERRDSYLLELARRLYQKLKSERREKECRALIAELRGELEEAGRLYLQLNERSKAIPCLWATGSWAHLAELAPQEGERYELAAALFMVGDRDLASSSALVEAFARLSSDPAQRARMRSDARCSVIIGEVLNSLEKLAGRSFGTPEVWRGLLAHLEQFGLDLPNPVALAQVAYRAGDLRRVAELWLKSGQKGTPPTWVDEALAVVEAYPARLEPLGRLGRWVEIIQQFEARPERERISESHAAIVVSAYGKAGWSEAGVALLERNPTESDLIEALKAVQLSPELVRRLGHLYASLLEEQHRWGELIAFARSRQVGGKPSSAQQALAQADASVISGVVIEVLASSSNLSVAPHGDRRRVQEFLEREVITTPREHPSVFTIAAAVERAGKHVSALQFYEKVTDGSWASTPDVRRFARERWLVVKNKQTEAAPDERKGALRREMEHKAQVWKIAPSLVSELPEFPTTASRERSDSLTGRPREKLGSGQRLPDAAPRGGSLPSTASSGDTSSGAESPDETDVRGIPSPAMVSNDGGAIDGSTLPRLAARIVRRVDFGSSVFEVTVFTAKARVEIRQESTGESVVVYAGRSELKSTDLEEDSHVSVPDAAGARWLVQPWLLGIRLCGTTLELLRGDEVVFSLEVSA